MKRYKCTVAYVGANYEGWQSQKNKRTVQEKIEEAISVITQEKTSIVASGRTDAGVSARGQVFHFDTKREMPVRKWMYAINGKLPKDIHITEMEEAFETFHARYCVKMKQYDYRINLGPYDVFTKDTVYQCPYTLDVEKMKAASKYFIGEHDFTSFNATSLYEKQDQVRTVKDISFSMEGNILKITFLGKGFLRYMVRMMVGQLIEAGRGRIPPEEIRNILEKRSKTASLKNAPPQGLTLQKVSYFEIMALSDKCMIREYLEGDEGYTDLLDQYVLKTRNTQKILGEMILKDAYAKIQVKDPSDREIVEELIPQLQRWMAYRNKQREIVWEESWK